MKKVKNSKHNSPYKCLSESIGSCISFIQSAYKTAASYHLRILTEQSTRETKHYLLFESAHNAFSEC